MRANSAEAKGRSTGEILKEGLETFDLSNVEKGVQKAAPKLWRLLSTLSAADRERAEPKNNSAASPNESGSNAQPAPKRRKTMTAIDSPTAASHRSQVGLPVNPPLTVTVLLLLLASSQVRNKFQVILPYGNPIVDFALGSLVVSGINQV